MRRTRKPSSKKVNINRTYKNNGKRNNKSKRMNKSQLKNKRKSQSGKRPVSRKGGAGTVWEITRDDAKSLITSNTNVGETDDNYEDLLNQVMQLQLNEESIGRYETHAQILQGALEHFRSIFGTEEEYIERMRTASDEDGEEYTNEFEAEDRNYYNRERRRAINRANTYRNDLHNYARALLNEWRESGESGSLL
tara:strand:+ start:639 stop:1220 length:582 start_codon:yes stop_codon:yes gene_type:complete